MKVKVMAVFDQASCAFLPPFCVASREMALRQFSRVISEQPKHDFALYPDQYTLYELGTFDNEFGTFSDLTPTSLGTIQVICSRVKVSED